MKSKRVLVIGASGFLGQALSRRLRADGYFVTALSRHAPAGAGEPWVQVNRYEESASLLAGQDCVVHLAARVHVMNDAVLDPLAEFRAANVDLTFLLARQAAQARVRRFIFISSVKVNGEETSPDRPFTAADTPQPLDPYGVSKMEAEAGLHVIAQHTGMEVVIVRPPLVYGPGVKANFASLMRAVKKGVPLPLGAIHNQRSLIGIDNLVDFLITCIDHPSAANETFLVSDGQDVSVPELVRGLADAMNVKAHLLPIPVSVLQMGASLLGKRDAVNRLCENLQVDIDKTRKLLKWNPPISLSEGLRRAVQGI